MERTAAIEGFALTEQDIKSFAEVACEWVFITDRNLNICYSQRCSAAAFDIPPHSVLGKHLSDLIDVENRKMVAEQLRPGNILPGRGAEVVYFDPISGVHILRALPFEGANGFQGFRITRQIIEGKSLAQLRCSLGEDKKCGTGQDESMQLQRQKLIADLSAEFTKPQPIEKLFSYVIHSVGSVLEVDRCAIFRYNEEIMTYSIEYEWCAPGVSETKAKLQDIPYSKESATYIKLTTSPYFAVEDTFVEAGDTYQAHREHGIRSFFYLPLVVNGSLWGALGLAYGKESHKWSQSEFHIIRTIGGIMIATLEKRAVEDKLYDAFSKLSEIVSNYPGIIWETDSQNVITLCEGRGLREVPGVQEMLLGVNLNEGIAGQDFRLFEHHNRTFTQGGQSYAFENGGKTYACETTCLYHKDGSISGVLGVALDVTEMKAMQTKLEAAIEEAQRANAAKTDFLSRMSHEIRTPMNAIIGMNEIAKKSDDPARIQYCLAKIEQASRQLLSLINDILDLSKIEAGKMEISEGPFDYEQVLKAALNVVQGRIEEKKLDFAFDLEGLCSRTLISDELRLTQVLINLLTNAVKFTPDYGKITLKSRFLNGTKEGALLRVSVKDTGIGISLEEQAKLFRSFEQADGSITRRFGGTGLGLAICKRIVGMMGGRIWVESVPGERATFIFEIPVKFGEITEKVKKLLPDTRGVRILVVDDSPEALEYALQIIRGFQMQCDGAKDGWEALELVKQAAKAGTHYDIIFLDWRMPGIDGIATAEEIRRLVSSDTVVIMISVADWSDLQEEATHSGLRYFLPKPLLPSTLLETIVDILGKTETNTRNPVDYEEETYNWTDKKILIAEDIEINREIISSLLEPTGVKLSFAENGSEAVELFSVSEQDFDVILMDLQMPGMDGYEATRRIRASETKNAKEIPILAMTANAFLEDVERCLAAGMNSHVAKPIDVDDLLSKLDFFLSKH